MIFKSISKVILAASTAGIGGVGVVAPTVAYAVESANSGHKINETSSKINLPGRNGRKISYDSVNAAVDDIVSKSSYSSKGYVGNFSKAISEKGINGIKYSEVQTKYLNEFTQTDIFKYAYKMGNGKYTDDMEQAISSYLDNLGYSYMDANGDIHSDLNKAQAINDYISKNKSTWGVSYYQIKDLASNKTININPLNKKDLETFKRITIKNLALNDSAFSIDKVFKNVTRGENVLVPAGDVLLTKSSESNMVSAIYNMMSILSNAKDSFKYNIKPLITNNSATIRSDYKNKLTDTSYGWRIKRNYESQQQTNLTYYYIPEHFNKELTNLTANQFGEFAPYFIHESVFREKVKGEHTAIAYWNVWLKDGQFIQKEEKHNHGFRYKLNVNGVTYEFIPTRENSEGTMWYGNDKKAPISIFGAGGDSYRSLDLSLNIRVDQSAINKSDIVNQLSNVIREKIVFKNIDLSWFTNSSAAEIVEQCNKLIYDYASKLFDEFIRVSSQTVLNKNEHVGYVSDSITSKFDSKKDSTTEFMTNKLKSLSDKQWWVKNLYDTGIFNDMSSLLVNIMSKLNSALEPGSYMISYNNVPVFLIKNINEITSAQINNNNDAIAALRNWLYSSSFDPSKLVNISNKLKYDELAKTISYVEEMNSMTSFNENLLPNNYSDTFKYINNNGNYNDFNLSFGQNLLANSDDRENLRNDTGIESAVYLYNKNIDKLINANNNSYVNSINKDNICDLDVLRLYENQTTTQTKKDFLTNPLPTYYGVIKGYNGTFNPAVAEKSIIIYQTDIDNIAQNISPIAIPTVEISGRTYIISKLINGDNAIINNSSLEILKDTLIRSLKHYIKADDNWIWKKDTLKNTQILVEREFKYVLTAKLSVAKFDANMFSETTKSFLTYEDFVNYVKSIVLLNATYVSDAN